MHSENTWLLWKIGIDFTILIGYDAAIPHRSHTPLGYNTLHAVFMLFVANDDQWLENEGIRFRGIPTGAWRGFPSMPIYQDAPQLVMVYLSATHDIRRGGGSILDPLASALPRAPPLTFMDALCRSIVDWVRVSPAELLSCISMMCETDMTSIERVDRCTVG